MSSIVIDTSALAAIVFNEPERDVFMAAILTATSVLICSATVLETRLVVQSRKGHEGVLVLNELLNLPLFDCTAPTLADVDAAYAAYAAFNQYGKGKGHPAQLNFGDLFSYATAKTRGLPLLYKGNDFAQTDLMPANCNTRASP
jgi:ribonuclease VapC